MEDVIREIRIRGASQQPDWSDLLQLSRVAEALGARPTLVQPDDLATLRTLLGKVALGEALVLQSGDCAEDPQECTRPHVARKTALLDLLAGSLGLITGKPVIRAGRIAGLRPFSMRAKSVPPRPPRSATRTPRSRRIRTVSRLRPKPTSLTITGTSTAAAILPICGPQDENDRSPSGITVSCTVLMWICRASASSRSIARRAFPTEAVALTFAMTNPSGCSWRSTRNVSAHDGSLKYALMDPDAMGTPVSRAAMARSRLMAPVLALPPVIALMYSGTCQSMPANVVARDTSDRSIPASAWWTNDTSSN